MREMNGNKDVVVMKMFLQRTMDFLYPQIYGRIIIIIL